MKYFLRFKTFLFLTICVVVIGSVVNGQSKPKKKPTTSPPKITKPISGGVLNGKAILLPKPEYPDEARKLKRDGLVKVYVLIDEEGNVISAKAFDVGENLIFQSVAEEAALKAKFSPTLLFGKSVKVTGTINYNFISQQGYESELGFMFAGMFLKVLRENSTNLEGFKKTFETSDLKTEITEITKSEVKSLAGYAEKLSTIESLSAPDRIKMVDDVVFGITSKLNESERWQFQLGENFGNLLYLVLSIAQDETPDLTKFDEIGFKLTISRISDLLNSKHPDFPIKVFKQMEEIVVSAKTVSASEPESFIPFVTKVGSLFETIDPSSSSSTGK